LIILLCNDNISERAITPAALNHDRSCPTGLPYEMSNDGDCLRNQTFQTVNQTVHSITVRSSILGKLLSCTNARAF